MSDATVFVSLAFLIVWMQRKKRWTNFFQALEGKVTLSSSPVTTGATPASSSSPASTTAGAAPESAANAAAPSSGGSVASASSGTIHP